ncbi:ubiquitin carboxyl-terminal hydrolase 40-like isoform X2 [Clavelina lepadiformis]|uniref:ubiquitin carboxyl-terminal hydrolase 40-like isoform X2 n=1 Tax=Clavelina lepadiformis TaxID=159417 RepID=UPI0040427E52
MFGELFKEENSFDSTTNNSTTTSIDGNPIDEPPKPRGPLKLVGFKNQGSTCYLNALLQTLFLTPEFRDGILQLTSDELGYSMDADSDPSNQRKIPYQLQLIFARLLLLNQNTCSTEGLTESFGWRNDEELQQHDVQELSRIFLDAIEASLVGTSSETLIQNLFKGKIVNQIVCDKCNRISERDEDFLDLTVSVTNNMKLLENSFSNTFKHAETMTGKNQYFCEQCNQLVDAKKRAKLKTLPPILTLSLLRFNYHKETFSRYKETSPFAFPFHLDMTPYVNCRSINSCGHYSLYSVIVHSGSAHRGHYQAHIRDVNKLGYSDIELTNEEIFPDFSKFIQTSETVPVIKNDIMNKKISDPINPEVILARIVAKHESMRLDELGQALLKATGSSWSKVYRKQYGTMAKFLRSNCETFNLDVATRTVSLCKSAHEKFLSDIALKCAENVEDIDKHSADASLLPNNSEYEDLTNSELGNAMGCCKLVNPNSCCCYEICSEEKPGTGMHWFNFNDENIKTISVNEIPKEFSGRKCAYMLFYRNDLSSSFEWFEKIPDLIKDMMNNENIHLMEWRTKYDLAVNRLDLHIYTEEILIMSNGLIKCVELDGYLMSFYQHQQVSELLSEIRYNLDRMIKKPKRKKLQLTKKTTEDIKISPLEMTNLNILKILPHGGIHLYESLPVGREITLKEAGIKNNSSLFLWNGKSVLNQTIQIGIEYEAISVKLICHYDRNSRCYLSFKASQSECLLLVRSYASKLLNTSSNEIVFQRKIKGNESHNEDADDCIEVIDNDISSIVYGYEENFTAFCKGCQLQEVQRNSELDETGDFKNALSDKCHNKTVHVQLEIINYDDEILQESIYELDIDEKMSIEALKSFVLCKLNLQEIINIEECRFSLHSKQSVLCLYDSITVSSLPFTNDDIFLLERGKAPTNEQVLIFLKPPNELKCIELLLSKSSKISEAFERILKELNLNGDEWHLRKCNRYGDLTYLLDDNNKTITEAKISNGDIIALAPGKLAEKGKMRLCIWIYPKCLTLPELYNKNIITSLFKSVDLDQSSRPSEAPSILGHVELKREDTLYDLQRKIKAIQTDKKMPDKYCIRIIDKGLLTKALPQGDNNTVTLKRLKIQPSTQLGIQPSTMEIGKEDVIIKVVFHIPNTRHYTSPVEYVCSRTTANLHGNIAKCIGFEDNELILAKRTNDAMIWSIIEPDQSSNLNAKKKVQKKGRKTTGKKKNIKENSVQLKDSDTVAAKIVSEELKYTDSSIDLQDFFTDEDILLKQKLKASNNQRSSSNAKMKDNNINQEKSPNHSIQAKESQLKIHVGNFSTLQQAEE